MNWIAYLFSALVIGGLAYSLPDKTSPRLIEPSTLCPLGTGGDGPSATNVILLDTTDPITQLQASEIRKRFIDLAKHSVPHETFVVYAIGAPASQDASPRLVLCNPGGRGKIETIEDKFTHLPASKGMFERRFSNGLNKILAEMLVLAPQPYSPIMESIQAAVASEFGPGVVNQSRRLIVVSDLVQNSREYSQTKALSDDGFYRSAFFDKVAVDLEGIDVRVGYIKRLDELDRQPKGHLEFWQRYFERLGRKSFDYVIIESSAWASSRARQFSLRFPIQGANQSRQNGGICNIDRVNDKPRSPIPIPVSGSLLVYGWAAIDPKDGVVPEAVVIVLKESDGREMFALAVQNSREDVAEAFGQPKMRDAGFVLKADISTFKGGYEIGVIQIFEGKSYACSVRQSLDASIPIPAIFGKALRK